LRAQGGARIIGLSTYGGQAALPGGSFTTRANGDWKVLWTQSPKNSRVQDRRHDYRAGRRPKELPLWRGAACTQIEAYKGTPAAMVHTMIKDTSLLPPGHPAKMANVIIDSVELNPVPKRIALGSDAYVASKSAQLFRQ
jgi:hypothetical protein